MSSLAIGEIRLGIESSIDSDKRRDLESWLFSGVGNRFRGRILPIDSDVADCSGRIEAAARSTTGKLPALDALIAATAIRHDLEVVTRNVKDYSRTGVRVLNPWRSPA